MNFENIFTLFRAQVDRYRDRPVFLTREGVNWASQTWGQLEEKVDALACAFVA
jgi:hypothetical protein